MNATCRLCGLHTADQVKVMTDLGQVTITQCMVCDRAKCGKCRRPVPGRLNRCSHCGNFLGIT